MIFKDANLHFTFLDLELRRHGIKWKLEQQYIFFGIRAL
jgi:hypothetical protein